MHELLTEAEWTQALASARTIAVLGAHDDPSRPACYVPDYLHAHGYRVLPVNPALAGRELWGQRVAARLVDLAEPVDIVDVFRRADALPAHVPDILAMVPRPALVWLQLGIVHHEVARGLLAAGIAVVQDQCTLAVHRRAALGPR